MSPDKDNVFELRPAGQQPPTTLPVCACGDPWMKLAVAFDQNGEIVSFAKTGECVSCGTPRDVPDSDPDRFW